MAISLTWRNLFALTGLVVIVLTAFAAAESAVMQWQLHQMDLRLNDRLTLYQKGEDDLQNTLERIETRLHDLEKSK